MKKRMLSGALLISLGLTSVQADENLWIYAQGTDTRPQGSWELKFMDVARLGKDSGSYEFHDFRPEIEYGVTDRLTLGVEGIFFHHDYDNVEWAPMVDTQGGPGGSFNKSQFGGVEVAAKYNILSPYKDPVGLSVGFAYEYRDAYRLDGAAIDQHSLVPQIFLQKNWLDDTLTLAFKGKMELEKRKSPGVLEEEIAFDLAMGLSYRIAPKWFVGIETRWQSDFLSPEEDGNPPEGRPSSWDWGEFQLGDQFQHGLYVGPSVHYAEEGWWATLGALWQVSGWSADGSGAARNNRNWDEHERLHIGVIVGFEFGGDDALPMTDFIGKDVITK
tara:strand:- start:6396 stop:7385 length:990 start_codon:yes stop_codon:yes gene_type:complete